MHMQLINLSEFVLEKNEFGLFKNNIKQIRKYAEFLQQDLTLSMFLPDTDTENKIKKVIFHPVSFVTMKEQGDVRFYSVGNTQVFNISKKGDNLYWHHNTIESLLSEMDETIEFVGTF